MIKPALLYKDRLEELYVSILYDEKYKFYTGWTTYKIDSIDDNTYERHQFVIVDEETDDVIGYVKYNVDYVTSVVSGLCIVSFKPNRIFGFDLIKIVDDIFMKYNFNKIEFLCVKGNPIQRHYDRFIEKFGGRMCGEFKQHTTLSDGTRRDELFYEIMRDDYLKNRIKYII